MRGEPTWWDLILLAGFVSVLFAMRACASEGDAQDRPHADLVRALVAESDGLHPDNAAIVFCFARRAEAAHITIDVEARRYVALFRVRHPSPRQAAILAWSPLWADAFARAEEDVASWEAGTLRDPCGRGLPDHFGQPTGEDWRRAVRLHWRRIACRGVRSAFWRRR